MKKLSIPYSQFYIIVFSLLCCFSSFAKEASTSVGITDLKVTLTPNGIKVTVDFSYVQQGTLIIEKSYNQIDSDTILFAFPVGVYTLEHVDTFSCLGIPYYRASIIDDLDNYNVTDWRGIPCSKEMEEDYEVEVWPNPITDDQLQVFVFSLDHEELELVITDAAGMEQGPNFTFKQQGTGWEGFIFNLADLPEGIYYASIIRGRNQKVKTFKLVKSH